MTRILRTVAILGFVLAAHVAAAQDQFFDSNGVRIRFVDRGKGEPIVLIHGNGGSVQGWIDSGVLPNLERDYRVIALDASARWARTPDRWLILGGRSSELQRVVSESEIMSRAADWIKRYPDAGR